MINRYAVISSTKPGDDKGITPPDGWKPITLPIFDITNTYKNEGQIYHKSLFNTIRQYDINVTPNIWDLLVIAVSFHVADTRIQRELNAQDGWTREIALYIPVHNPELWNSQKQLLQKIFAFLTGDIWYLEFRQSKRKWELSKKKNPTKLETQTVCLFSGGLDSFTGAIDLIENGLNPLLVGYSGGSIESGPQNKCYGEIKSHYKDFELSFAQCYIRIPKDIIEGKERTQRGRSFLFFTLGTLFATREDTDTELYIPENGLISLNIPLTSSRVGSASTRTTHPFYMNRFQELLDNIGAKVTITNPYRFKTKGEMLIECQNHELLKKSIHHTMSCSHPNSPSEGGGFKACGNCIPDLIRRASILKLCDDPTEYRTEDLNKFILDAGSKGQGVRAFQIVLKKIMDKPQITSLLIHKTGPLRDDPGLLPQYEAVFRRGLEEVAQLIKNSKTKPM